MHQVFKAWFPHAQPISLSYVVGILGIAHRRCGLRPQRHARLTISKWSAEDLLKLDHWQAAVPDGPSASVDRIDDSVILEEAKALYSRAIALCHQSLMPDGSEAQWSSEKFNPPQRPRSSILQCRTSYSEKIRPVSAISFSRFYRRLH